MMEDYSRNNVQCNCSGCNEARAYGGGYGYASTTNGMAYAGTIVDEGQPYGGAVTVKEYRDPYTGQLRREVIPMDNFYVGIDLAMSTLNTNASDGMPLFSKKHEREDKYEKIKAKIRKRRAQRRLDRDADLLINDVMKLLTIGGGGFGSIGTN